MSAGNLIKKANQLKREGKLDEAIALYHQAIEINPHFAWTYYDLGDALVKKGNLDEAIACYSQGLKVNPNSAWLFYGLGDALAQQGDLEAAVEYLQKAIEIQPEIRGNIKLLGLYEDVCARLNNSRKVGDNSQVLRPAKKTIRSPVLPKDTLPDDHGQYVLHKYLNEEGHFDYDRYARVQEAGNERKLDQVWVKKENIEFLSTYLQDKLGTVSNGICHGTRRGLEQTWFREFLSADVIGTEISRTASQFPYTIQWDFHDVNPDWKDFFDFIYTNAFDHSYDPEKCLNTWIDCLKNDGMCIIEHSKYHGVSSTSELDPFGAEASVMPMLVNLWGQGKYAVSDVLNSPLDDGLKTVFFVIKKIRAT
jgi:hypothetical protein